MQRGLTLLLLLCLLPPCTFAVRSAKKRKAQAVGQTSRSARVLQDPPLTTLDHRPLRWKTLKARLLPVTHFDPTAGDNVDGDELEVRRAAVDALGPYNGTVVVVDPQTGRVLTIVNQKTALDSGFTPCSTIKLVTAFAALNEGLIERHTARLPSPPAPPSTPPRPCRFQLFPFERSSAPAWARRGCCTPPASSVSATK